MNRRNQIVLFIIILAISQSHCSYTILHKHKSSENTNIRNYLTGIDSILAILPPIELENSEAFWEDRIHWVEIGMTREDVFKILPKYKESTAFGGEYEKERSSYLYWVDLKWQIYFIFDHTGDTEFSKNRYANKIIERPKLVREDFRSYMIE